MTEAEKLKRKIARVKRLEAQNEAARSKRKKKETKKVPESVKRERRDRKARERLVLDAIESLRIDLARGRISHE